MPLLCREVILWRCTLNFSPQRLHSFDLQRSTFVVMYERILQRRHAYDLHRSNSVAMYIEIYYAKMTCLAFAEK